MSQRLVSRLYIVGPPAFLTHDKQLRVGACPFLKSIEGGEQADKVLPWVQGAYEHEIRAAVGIFISHLSFLLFRQRDEALVRSVIYHTDLIGVNMVIINDILFGELRHCNDAFSLLGVSMEERLIVP